MLGITAWNTHTLFKNTTSLSAESGKKALDIYMKNKCDSRQYLNKSENSTVNETDNLRKRIKMRFQIISWLVQNEYVMICKAFFRPQAFVFQ